MNKEELTNLIDSLNLNLNDYYIISGGSLLLQDLRNKTNDLDLAINANSLKLLKENFNLIEINPTKFSIGDNIECFLESNEEILKNRVVIDGYSCQSLKSIYELKKRLNRPKDLEDIKRLEKKLKL